MTHGIFCSPNFVSWHFKSKRLSSPLYHYRKECLIIDSQGCFISKDVWSSFNTWLLIAIVVCAWGVDCSSPIPIYDSVPSKTLSHISGSGWPPLAPHESHCLHLKRFQLLSPLRSNADLRVALPWSPYSRLHWGIRKGLAGPPSRLPPPLPLRQVVLSLNHFQRHPCLFLRFQAETPWPQISGSRNVHLQCDRDGFFEGNPWAVLLMVHLFPSFPLRSGLRRGCLVHVSAPINLLPACFSRSWWTWFNQLALLQWELGPFILWHFSPSIYSSL